jgi:hypothetical protein
MTERELLLKALKTAEDLTRFLDDSLDERNIRSQKVIKASCISKLDMLVKLASLSHELREELYGKNRKKKEVEINERS